MKKIVLEISNEQLIKDYQELKSSYKIANKYKTSTTAVKRILKELGILRNQSLAAHERNLANPKIGRYKRTTWHKQNLSEHAKKRKRSQNSNFKHGKYSGLDRKLDGSKWRELKKEALKRDKFNCFFCKINKNLIAHHLIPVYVCKEARHDLENLVIVCRKCHFEHAHKKDWHDINQDMISDNLLHKYDLDRERLSEKISFMKSNFRWMKDSAIV